MRTRLVALIAVVLAAAVGLGTFLTISIAPAGHPQAEAWEQASLPDELTGATVLGLGEATHGTREFQLARLQLLRKTASLGFTTITLETDAGSASEVDAWLQGGPGTVEEATAKLGFRLYRTREMAELLAWTRAYNADNPAPGARVRLYGVDAVWPRPNVEQALGWLESRDAPATSSLRAKLAPYALDERLTAAQATAVAPLARELRDAVERVAAKTPDGDDAALRAQLSARALTQLAQGPDQARDSQMAEQLSWLVDRRASAGGQHTLLFAHNGHVDKAGQATSAPGPTLGRLAARRWGGAYRAIGTDFHHGSFRASDGGDQRPVSQLTVNSPLRGLYAGIPVGFVAWSRVHAADRAVLQKRVPMVSTGEPYLAWYGWVPFLHEVYVVPEQAWDAVIYVEEAQAVTPLP